MGPEEEEFDIIEGECCVEKRARKQITLPRFAGTPRKLIAAELSCRFAYSTVWVNPRQSIGPSCELDVFGPIIAKSSQRRLPGTRWQDLQLVH